MKNSEGNREGVYAKEGLVSVNIKKKKVSPEPKQSGSALRVQKRRRSPAGRKVRNKKREQAERGENQRSVKIH